MASVDRAPITAIITAYRRIDSVLETIARVQRCDPAPAEILVHVDGNERATVAAIAAAYPSITVLLSEHPVGPGGARNRLMASATQALVASFDDDAYPMDADYFSRVLTLFRTFPEAAIITGRVFHLDETVTPAVGDARWAADFAGGASSYRASVFAGLGGYVPVPMAYGMEEVDLALRLHASGGRILETGWLRIFHDTDRKRHAEPAVTAATISNLAVLASLRYPPSLWPVGAAQCLNRVRWLLTHGRSSGVLRGLLQIPREVHHYRDYRRTLPSAAIRSYLRLRRHPIPALPADLPKESRCAS